MAMKYLDKDGLLYIWQKIKTAFALKTELPTKTSQLTNDSGYKTTDTTYTMTQDGTDGHKITLTPSTGTPTTITIPDNNTTYNDATATSRGLMTTAHVNKLTGIEDGAQVNKLETVKVNGTAQTITDKAVNITVPTNNNTLANGAGYQTAAQVTSAINAAVGSITGMKFEKVTTLPATGSADTIYLVPHTHGTDDIHDEYIWYNNAFEKIGSTDIDLTGYVLTTDLTLITNAEIDAICV